MVTPETTRPAYAAARMDTVSSSTFVLLNIFKLKDDATVDQETIKTLSEGLAAMTKFEGRVVQQSFGVTMEEPKKLYWLLRTYRLISSSFLMLTEHME